MITFAKSYMVQLTTMNLIGLFLKVDYLEMNAAKAFMSCNWEVFMEEICLVLGFVSENAKNYIKKEVITINFGKLLK